MTSSSLPSNGIANGNNYSYLDNPEIILRVMHKGGQTENKPGKLKLWQLEAN